MKKNLIATAIVALLCGYAQGKLAMPVSEHDEIELLNGSNDIRVSGGDLRVIKGIVGSVNASRIETYTTYISPDRKGGAWIHVTGEAMENVGNDLAFQAIESAESNVQSIAFFRAGGELFVVQALREEAKATQIKVFEDIRNFHMGSVKMRFSTYKLKIDTDVPQFVKVDMRESLGRYVNARDAIKQEIFLKSN